MPDTMKNLELPIWLFNAFVFFVIFISGLAFSYWKMESMLEQETRNQLVQAAVRVEAILGHAKSASEKGAMYAGSTCTDSVLSALRAHVAAIPDVRSINLAKYNQIYCTTVYGSRHFDVDGKDYTQGKLLLLNGNELTPYRSLIVYRNLTSYGNSVLAGVDGYYLYNILKLIDSKSHFYIQVGNKFMSKDGIVITQPGVEKTISQDSSLYPFSVVADISQIYTFSTFLQHSWDSIALVVFFSVLTSFLMSRYVLYRKTLDARLHKAIKKAEISPWIQPIYDAENEQIAGGEILLRWLEPGKDYIAPDIFIKLAEENGTIKELTSICFINTAKELKEFSFAGYTPLIICFNVSAWHFKNKDILSLCDYFSRLVSPNHFRIVLEVTEREIITDSLETQEVIESLKERHIALSLDDFGTGNANYSYVKLFSPDYLKIDKMFTSGVENDRVCQYVISSIINLARKLGCAIIAEGVENETQKQMLRAMGVTHFQGYYFSIPVPLNEFKNMLEQTRAADDNTVQGYE
ncbi:cyclic diguanylate phosphodiesterase (plasmid) [Enterobacter asburiae]